MAREYSRLSRVLSHALRHEPWLYELELDADGWVAVEAVLAALREERADWRDLAETDLAEMMRRAFGPPSRGPAQRTRELAANPGPSTNTPANPIAATAVAPRYPERPGVKGRDLLRPSVGRRGRRLRTSASRTLRRPLAAR